MRSPGRGPSRAFAIVLGAASALSLACAKLDTGPNVALIEESQSEEARFVESQYEGEAPSKADPDRYGVCRVRAREQAEAIAGVPTSGTVYASGYGSAYEAALRRCLAAASPEPSPKQD